MTYKRFSPDADTFLVIRFKPVFGKTEFFNSHGCYRQQLSFAFTMKKEMIHACILQATIQTTSPAACEAVGEDCLSVTSTVPALLPLGEPSGKNSRGAYHTRKSEGQDGPSGCLGRN